MTQKIKNFSSLILLASLSSLFGIAHATPSPSKAAKASKTCTCSCKQPSSLSEPNLSHTNFQIWAKEAAIAAFSYNHKNYQQSLKNASQFFTTEGWKNFSTALGSSGNLQSVIKNQSSMNATALTPPTVISHGVVNGVYTWTVEVPLLIEYDNHKKIQQQSLNVRMKIVRTKATEGNQHLGIVQIIAQPQDNLTLTGF